MQSQIQSHIEFDITIPDDAEYYYVLKDGKHYVCDLSHHSSLGFVYDFGYQNESIALPERKDAIELKKMLEVGNLTADLRVVKVNRAPRCSDRSFDEEKAEQTELDPATIDMLAQLIVGLLTRR